MTDDKRKNNRHIHVGLIPDGNRRWAEENGKPVWAGHWAGAERIEQFVEWCLDYPKIKRISIFALSTENLNRNSKEVRELWSVYEKNFRSILTNKKINDNHVRVRILGNDGLWKPGMKDIVKEVAESTKNYSKHMLNIMLAYGSKFEINRAVKGVVGKPLQTLDKFLLVKEPLDLVIRTGRQHRLSNFMLYQASYAEIYFSDTLWPDFNRKEFDKIMEWYDEQQQKFGK